ncbi:hypothetical protein ACSBR1_018285 [Camellia fascicularis]
MPSMIILRGSVFPASQPASKLCWRDTEEEINLVSLCMKIINSVVILSYLNLPLFQDLLHKVEEEFGFTHPLGGLNVP